MTPDEDDDNLAGSQQAPPLPPPPSATTATSHTNGGDAAAAATADVRSSDQVRIEFKQFSTGTALGGSSLTAPSGGGGGSLSVSASTSRKSTSVGLGGQDTKKDATPTSAATPTVTAAAAAASAGTKRATSNRFVARLNCFFLLVVVPFLLLICILLRINFQSVVYLFMLFMLPFFYPINIKNIQGSLKRYLIALIILSLLGLLGQLVFQIVLLTNPPYANEKILPNCSFKQEILEEFGFSRYDTAYLYDIFRILVPDVLLLIGSLISLHLCKRVQSLYVAAKREQVYSAATATAAAGALGANQTMLLAASTKAATARSSASASTSHHQRSPSPQQPPPATATTFTDRFCPLENVTTAAACEDEEHVKSRPGKLSTTPSPQRQIRSPPIVFSPLQTSRGPLSAVRKVSVFDFV